MSLFLDTTMLAIYWLLAIQKHKIIIDLLVSA